MHVRHYQHEDVTPSYGWDDDYFAELEGMAGDIVDKFIGFCEGARDVPYFERYFHVEFPEPTTPIDEAELQANVEEIREKFDLNDHEVESLIKVRRVEQEESSQELLYEHSIRALVLNGLFLEKMVVCVSDKAGAKYYRSPNWASNSDEWVTVVKAGKVVLKGRRNLHTDQDTGEPTGIGFRYRADRHESLLTRSFGGVTKLGKFVLGVALRR